MTEKKNGREWYSRRLQRPEWKRKRDAIVERDGFKCMDCGSAHSQLHVHHCLYRKNREPWEYEDGVLRTLCDDCHHARHLTEEECIEAFKVFLSGKTRHDLYCIHSSLITPGCYVSDPILDSVAKWLESRGVL